MLPASYDLPAIKTQDDLEGLIKMIIEKVVDAHHLLCLQNGLIIEPIINETSIISSLALFKIIKIPKFIYQIMHDAAPRNNSRQEVEDAKYRVQHILKEYIKDTFPIYTLETFADFSGIEAEAIYPSLDWGMYVKLVRIEPQQKLTHDRTGTYITY